MSTATFVKSDTTTQGTWYSGTTPVYGSDGYGMVGNASSNQGGTIPVTQGFFSYPAYATVTVAGESAYCWANPTNAVRAVEYAPPGTSNGTDTKRVAAAWFSSTNFTIDISDGTAHQIALYFLDWDNVGRVQQIQITDDNNNNAVLDTRSISAFSNGIWLVWTVSGKVTFKITMTSGVNCVVNGVFFDPAPSGGTTGTLGAQSATWSNPTLGPSFAVSLVAQSLTATNPALAPEFSLSLSGQSGAWSNPALSSALLAALSGQSATWSNPALSSALLAALAGQSAAWSNPGLAVAVEVALAAQSANWSANALASALSILLSTPAALWDNPDIVPAFSGTGITVVLSPQSAVWQNNPLTAIFVPSCPNNLRLNYATEFVVLVNGGISFAGECCVINNTEQITLFRKTADGSFDSGTVVPNAFSPGFNKDFTGGSRGIVKKNTNRYLLWQQQTGDPFPKLGDVVQESDGTRWTIWKVEVQAFGARFLVDVKQEM